jgi:CheY-like chemotaxis protein
VTLSDSSAVANGIIAADNDHLLRGVLRSLLTRPGFSVFLAADGVEALQFAQRMLARLVLLDLNMPKMNGLCACEFIRQLPGYRHVPIVILTAYDSEDTRMAARLVGATDFVAKPFKPSDLLRVVTPLLAAGSRIGPSFQVPLLAEPVGQVWTHVAPEAPNGADPPKLAQAREVLRIYRG